MTFAAPCNCADVSDGLVINEEIYTVCDAMGKCVTGVGGAWASGAQVSVVLDCENKKAYIQNSNRFAPAGYGLGTVAEKDVSFAEIDNLTANGWYRLNGESAIIDGFSFSNAVIRCDSHNKANGTQTLYPITSGKILYKLQRLRYKDELQPWEWENPPMKPDVEYRTTERIGGKAVYKKNIDGVINYCLEGETTWTPYHSLVGAAAASHNHSASNITSGTLAVANGGTGKTSLTGSSGLLSALHPTNGVTDYIATIGSGYNSNGYCTPAALATAMGAAKIARGSYTGTGTYGSSNPTTITCGFKPKMVLIANTLTTSGSYWPTVTPTAAQLIWIEGFSSYNSRLTISQTSTGLSYYTSETANGASYQLNKSSTKFHWVAIG